ncbi:fimbrial outer membrane usher protein [Salmonella enterica subsp. enterica serovar Heidelberg]|nr:fimbrial outer membrane usher protein [Salmonella enterica subsp. enterica serovar Heidelberg]
MYCLKTGIAASMHFILLTMPASITVTIRILAVVKVLTFGSIAVFNLLGWQAHADTTFNKTDGSSGEWKSNTLYLERGIAELLGTLRAGDQYTSSEIF